MGLRWVSSLPRVRACGRNLIYGVSGPQVRVDDEGVARYSGLQTCGSVWACPVCSAAIRERRAVEVEAVTTAALLAGGEVEFLTFTVPHTGGDRLDELLRVVSKSWGAVTSGRGWGETGAAGFVRAVEVTDGYPNGWHPHLHVLVFFPGQRAEAERLEFRGWVTERWGAAVARLSAGSRQVGERVGVRAQPVRLVRGRADVGEYLSKVQDGFGDDRDLGREMTRGDLKSGRRRNRWSAFEVLERAIAGDRRAQARWWEYEAATKGRRCLEWSRSAAWKQYRAGLGVPVDHADDDQAAAAAPGTVIAEIAAASWHLVVTYRAEARLLDLAELRGAAGVDEVLAQVRARHAHELVAAARRRRLRPVIPAPA